MSIAFSGGLLLFAAVLTFAGLVYTALNFINDEENDCTSIKMVVVFATILLGLILTIITGMVGAAGMTPPPFNFQ